MFSIVYIFYFVLIKTVHVFYILFYQAILAKNEFGYRLTKNFLISSKKNNAAPKPNAGQTYLTGTGRVLNTLLNHGTRVINRPTEVEKRIPNIIVKLRDLPKNGFC